MNADFLEHFDYVIENFELGLINTRNKVRDNVITIQNKNLVYLTDFQKGLPVMDVKEIHQIYNSEAILQTLLIRERVTTKRDI